MTRIVGECTPALHWCEYAVHPSVRLRSVHRSAQVRMIQHSAQKCARFCSTLNTLKDPNSLFVQLIPQIRSNPAPFNARSAPIGTGSTATPALPVPFPP